jgi:hypothetical protein
MIACRQRRKNKIIPATSDDFYPGYNPRDIIFIFMKFFLCVGVCDTKNLKGKFPMAGKYTYTYEFSFSSTTCALV